MYVNRKMMKLFQEWGEGGLRRMMEGVSSSLIYCKNFCKCHNVNQYNNKMIKNKTNKKCIVASFTIATN
jgi:hypothetical protein